MKKIIPFLLATILFTAAGCSSNDDDPVINPPVVENGTYTGILNVDQDGDQYEQKDVKVVVTFDSGRAEIKMFQVSFSDDMPIKLDMTIPGITTTETSTGITLYGDGIVPLAMGGEFPKFTIHDMSGKVTSESISFEMDCGSFPTKFTGLRKTE